MCIFRNRKNWCSYKILFPKSHWSQEVFVTFFHCYFEIAKFRIWPLANFSSHYYKQDSFLNIALTLYEIFPENFCSCTALALLLKIPMFLEPYQLEGPKVLNFLFHLGSQHSITSSTIIWNGLTVFQNLRQLYLLSSPILSETSLLFAHSSSSFLPTSNKLFQCPELESSEVHMFFNNPAIFLLCLSYISTLPHVWSFRTVCKRLMYSF